MISAAIFDLDGILVNSEPLWRRAEMEILGKLGVALTGEMCRETQGTRVDRAITHWYERYPWEGPSVEEVATTVVDRVLYLVATEAEPMPGAIAAVALFVEKGIPVAVCSSSWTALIDAALERIGLSETIAVRHSAEAEEYGKPHPACYITTAAKLGVAPQECLVFEDSFYGALAGKAALMAVAAVPEPYLRDPVRWGFCDAVLNSLEDVNQVLLAHLGAC